MQHALSQHGYHPASGVYMHPEAFSSSLNKQPFIHSFIPRLELTFSLYCRVCQIAFDISISSPFFKDTRRHAAYPGSAHTHPIDSYVSAVTLGPTTTTVQDPYALGHTLVSRNAELEAALAMATKKNAELEVRIQMVRFRDRARVTKLDLSKIKYLPLVV